MGRIQRAVSATAVAALGAAGLTALAPSLQPLPSAATPATCQLANGVKHVIHITFDNVHFFRDNPNVPSDIEQMPTLLNFIHQSGTLLSNMHTPLIAHTADDSLTIYSGLYGDRHGMANSNSYKSYHPDGTTESDGSFVYWTSPVFNSVTKAASATDLSPSMVYASNVPAKNNAPTTVTPAPWVPFTRAGCSVGDFSTANMVLENTGLDIPTVFGPSSPETAQLNADPSSFKDRETADYVGVAVHCAQGDAVCANAQAVKFGQASPSPSAVADQLPDEPGGYNGYQALFGHRYVAPQLGAGTPNKTSNGFPVTNAAGNLVALDGHELRNSFANQPGFPGFSPLANESLAYLADMLEAGIPVTYGYISDIHERKPGTSGCTSAGATGSGFALGPGDSCYVSNAAAYDAAFKTFFDRLAADGMNPSNTLLIIGSEEDDHLAGANVGRASAPTPAGCDGVTVACHYTATQVAELNPNIPGLLATQRADTTPFDLDPQGATIYVRGQPGPSDPTVRQLQRDMAAITNPHNPYSGLDNEKIVNYQAGAVEQSILHIETADPLRTPTFTVFPKGDYFFSQGPANCNSPCVPQLSRFAWDHGYYAPSIDITWSAFAGPGVAHKGVDGRAPAQGPSALDPNDNGTVPQFSDQGTWADETDVRPTMLQILGLRDDYTGDGRVISEILSNPSANLVATRALGACYKQVNASVGEFGTITLLADTAALASGSPADDTRFVRTEATLLALGRARDSVATAAKTVLTLAAFGPGPGFNPGVVGTVPTVGSLANSCQSLLASARQALAAVSP